MYEDQLLSAGGGARGQRHRGTRAACSASRCMLLIAPVTAGSACGERGGNGKPSALGTVVRGAQPMRFQLNLPEATLPKQLGLGNHERVPGVWLHARQIDKAPR